MVKVYSTNTCPWCDKAKSYLKSKGIEFEELNVQEDMVAREEMIIKSCTTFKKLKNKELSNKSERKLVRQSEWEL